jgi:hypothetical protein
MKVEIKIITITVISTIRINKMMSIKIERYNSYKHWVNLAA